jgi:hypothetical protein
MDSNNYNQVLQKCLSNVDEIKEKLDSDKYLEISNSLISLYKISENKFYKVRYLTQRFSKNGKNSYLSMFKEYNQIILLSDEECGELKKRLTDGNGYTTACCNMILQGIRDRLNHPKYNELIGHFEANSISDEDEVAEISDLSFELTIVPTVAFLSVTKL